MPDQNQTNPIQSQTNDQVSPLDSNTTNQKPAEPSVPDPITTTSPDNTTQNQIPVGTTPPLSNENSDSPPPPILTTPQENVEPAQPQPVAATPPQPTPEAQPQSATATQPTQATIQVPPVVATSSGGGGFFNKLGKKKIATVLGLLLIVFGVFGAGAGIYLTQQEQVVEEEAFLPPEPPDPYYHTFSCKDGDKVLYQVHVTPISESPECPRIECPASSPNELSSYSTTYRLEFDPKDSGIAEFQVTTANQSNWCEEPCGHKIGDPSTPSSGGYDGHCEKNEVMDYPVHTFSSDNNFQKDITITRESDNGSACGAFQTDLWVTQIETSSGICNNLVSEKDPHYISYGLCFTGLECPGDVPTPTPTPTPPPGEAACLEVRAYKIKSGGSVSNAADWTRIEDTADLLTLESGDAFYLTVRGQSNNPQGFTKAKFIVNGQVLTETATDKKPAATADPDDVVEIYYSGTITEDIPIDTNRLEFGAEIYHEEHGWLGGN